MRLTRKATVEVKVTMRRTPDFYEQDMESRKLTYQKQR